MDKHGNNHSPAWQSSQNGPAEPHFLKRNRPKFRDWLLTVALLSPLLTGAVRKIVPGQPSWIESSSIIIFAAVCVYFMFSGRRGAGRLPSVVVFSVAAWIAFQAVYCAIGLAVDWRTAVTAFAMRIVPMFGVWIGFRAAESRRSFELLADTLAVFLITLVPFAIAGAILGSDRLPAVLQTVELYAEFGGGTRARDLSAFAGPTASAGVMAGIAMGGFFLSLGRVLSGDRRGHVLNLAGLVAAMLLLVFCGKRGPLILSIAFGLLMMMAVKRAKRGVLIILVVAGTAMIGVKAVDRMRTGSGYESSYGEHAGDLDIENRFYNIFWGTVTAWAEAAPVGSYLGNWGAEWRAFNGLKGVVVETGAALLIAETGILGALIFPFVIGICVISAYRASKSIHARPIVLCLLCFEVAVAAQFYFQVYGIMMGGGFTPLLFWTSFGIAYSAIQGSAPSPRLRCA